MRQLRLGSIGAGARAQAHFGTINGLRDRFEWVAVCDVAAERAAAAASKYGLHPYTDLEEMLKSERLDVVDVVVPMEGAHIVGACCARHGVNVHSETAISSTLPCADYLIEACQRNGVLLEVSEQVWRWPFEVMKQRIIAADLIGPVVRAYVIGTTAGYHAFNAIRTVIAGQPVLARGLTRDWPVDLIGRDGKPTDTESWHLAIVEFDDGALGINETASTYWAPLRNTRPTWMEVAGAKGSIDGPFTWTGHKATTLRLQGPDGSVRNYPVECETIERDGKPVPLVYRVETDPPITYQNPFADRPLNWAADWRNSYNEIAVASQLTGLYNGIVNGTAPGYGWRNARQDQELNIACRESGRRGGEPVPLPLRGITEYERGLHEQFRERWGGDPLEDVDKLLHTMFTPGYRR
ncbi:MAG TPA: Gfo/Idh/MocA family oxidoreductase [Chloroflexota bacterium]|jgi:predicted dehydrogenase